MNVKTAKEEAAKHRADKVVINASRRTDIPAFHIDELISGLKDGVFHPQGKMQAMWKFLFGPSDIHSVGLWSQDFSKWIERRKEVQYLGYKFWYRFTILPDDPVCKPKAPPVAEQLKQLEKLVEVDGPEVIFLFVDPLMQYRKIGEKDWRYNFSDESLGHIFKKARESGITSVSTSILDYYKKIENRGKKKGVEFLFLNGEDPENQKEMVKMILTFKGIADEYGLEVRTCSELFLHTSRKTIQGACVDGRRLNKLFGPGASVQPAGGQRTKYGCGCTASVDIGRYINKGEWSHSCGHGCLQCYARP